MQQCCNKDLYLISNRKQKTIKNMKITIKDFLSLAIIATVLFTGCKDDPDPIVPNEEELITTVNYTLSPAGGGDDIVLSYTDLDGDGSGAAVIVGGTLSSQETYVGSLELLNETEDPAEDITLEIQEEDEEHQFFFEVTGADLSVAYTDTDADGNPVGLSTSVTAGAVSSGTLKVTLKHEPVKDATGVSDGDITNAGGETDIEVSFPINVE